LSIHLVHCSDIHLDKNFNYGDPQRSTKRRQDVENNFQKIVDFALKEKSDFFVISGDVFDKVNPSNTARSFLVRQIKRLEDKNIEVFLIGGNHDVPKMGTQMLAIDILESAGLATVFSDSENFQQKTVTRSGEDIQIVGKSYYSRNQTRNPFSNFNISKQAKHLVCLLHGSLVGMNVAPNNPHVSQYNPFGTNDINNDIDYLALGHFHNYFDRTNSSTLICNPGSIEKLSWSESNDQKRFAFIELSDGNKNLEYINLESRNFKFKEIQLDKKIKNINEFIIKKIKEDSDSEDLLRLTLKGIITSEQQKTFKISDLARSANDDFFHVDFDFQVDVEGYGRVFLGKVESPIQAFENHFDKQLEKTTDVKRQEFLQQAKQLGIQYLGAQNDTQ